MGRVGVFAILATVCLACAGHPVATCPRTTHTATGFPTLASGSADALLTHPNRKCQVVFEPAFAVTHAVYLASTHPGTNARMFVAVRQTETVSTYSAPLDCRTAAQLELLCMRWLTEHSVDCTRRGVDGTWFHVAHAHRPGRYLARSFWSPRQDSDAAKLVELAEAMRNYAVAPESLRAVYGQRLNRVIRAGAPGAAVSGQR